MYLRQKEDDFLIKCNKKAQKTMFILVLELSVNYQSRGNSNQGPSGQKTEKPLKTYENLSLYEKNKMQPKYNFLKCVPN